MATTHPPASSAWPDLARQWQDLVQQWSRMWLAAAQPTVATATDGTIAQPSAAAVAPGVALPFDPAAVAALNAQFAPRFQALWSVAQGGLAGDAHAVSEVATPGRNDRRFAS